MNIIFRALLTSITIVSIIGLAFTIGFGPIIYLNGLETDAKDLACSRIGFKLWEGNMGQDYCEDSSYNLHYIKLIREGSNLSPKYKAVKISIGDVTTKQDVIRDK